MKQILINKPAGWYIKRINQPTKAKTFSGQTRTFDHYYRVFDKNGNHIPYCKFQQIDRFATIMGIPIDKLVIINDV